MLQPQKQLQAVLDALPQSGNCPICSTENRNRCTRCKKVFYCTVDHQKQDWKNHKPNCTPFASTVQQWTVNELEEATKKDKPPTGEEVRRDYGFLNCKNEAEEDHLLKVYTGVINAIKRDLVRLHEACITGKLKELITTEFEKYGEPCLNYNWFKENPDVVKNQYPLPTDTVPAASSEPAPSTSASAIAAQPIGPASTTATATTEVKAEPPTDPPAEPMAAEMTPPPDVKTEGGAAAGTESKPEEAVKSEPNP